MPSPFPGMDPYLEHPDLWVGLHNQLIVAIAQSLNAQLRPRYWVSVEGRTYVTTPDATDFLGRPDAMVLPKPLHEPSPAYDSAIAIQPRVVELPMPDEITETFLRVRQLPSREIVTVIEVLSPTNKRHGEGRRMYEEKREQTLRSRTHLVEIDLLRAGQPMLFRGNGHDSHYRILISRAHRRPRAELYAFSVRDPIPAFRLPLLPGDAEPLLDLGALAHRVYDQGGFDLEINYQDAPVPPLEGEDAAWADQLLRERGLRSASRIA